MLLRLAEVFWAWEVRPRARPWHQRHPTTKGQAQGPHDSICSANRWFSAKEHVHAGMTETPEIESRVVPGAIRSEHPHFLTRKLCPFGFMEEKLFWVAAFFPSITLCCMLKNNNSGLCLWKACPMPGILPGALCVLSHLLLMTLFYRYFYQSTLHWGRNSSGSKETYS